MKGFPVSQIQKINNSKIGDKTKIRTWQLDTRNVKYWYIKENSIFWLKIHLTIQETFTEHMTPPSVLPHAAIKKISVSHLQMAKVLLNTFISRSAYFFGLHNLFECFFTLRTPLQGMRSHKHVSIKIWI